MQQSWGRGGGVSRQMWYKASVYIYIHLDLLVQCIPSALAVVCWLVCVTKLVVRDTQNL